VYQKLGVAELKNIIKKTFALIIAVIIVIIPISVSALDYNDMAEPIELSLGTNEYDINADYVYTVFSYEPAEVAEYVFTAEGKLMGIASYNGMWITYEPGESTVTDESVVWNCTGVGQNLWITVKTDNASSVAVTVAKNEKEKEEEIPWTKYQNVHTPASFTFDGNAGNLAVIDTKDGVDDSPFLGDDGFYHFKSVTGPIIYADLDDSKMNLVDAQSYGQIKYIGYEEDKIVTKIDFYDAFEEYSVAADSTTKLYPLTEDLIQIYKLVGQSRGWYGEGGWIGGTDQDCWMFACYYDTTELAETLVQNVVAEVARPLYEGVGDDLYYTLYLTVNYKDGTVLKANAQELAMKFPEDLVIDTSSCDSNSWLAGDYKAIVTFMNVSDEFDVSIIENPYKEIEISGENELKIAMKTEDGKTLNAKALGFDCCVGDADFSGGYLITDIGTFNVTFSYDCDSEFNPLYDKNLTVSMGEITSNSLDGNKWLENLFYKDEIVYSIRKYRAQCEFLTDISYRYDSFVASEKIDDIITVSSDVCGLTQNCDNLITEGTKIYAVCSADEVENGVYKVFGDVKIDITKAAGYDSAEQTVKVLLLEDGNDSGLKEFGYNNGKWYAETECYEFESFNNIYITLNEDLTVSSFELGDKKALNVRDLVRVKKHLAGVCTNIKISDDYSKEGVIDTLDLTVLRKQLLEN